MSVVTVVEPKKSRVLAVAGNVAGHVAVEVDLKLSDGAKR
jgi:hypothetical protein